MFSQLRSVTTGTTPVLLIAAMGFLCGPSPKPAAASAGNTALAKTTLPSPHESTLPGGSIGLNPPWGSGSMAHWVAQTRTRRMAWWRSGRFGMFIHWDPVSIVGKEISWSRKAPRAGCPIPLHSSKHPGINPTVPQAVYDNLYKMFNPTAFNADQWVAIAKSAGMKYMVFTAMHCDGFCMFNTRYTDYNIMHTPYGRDICAQLAAAAHKADMPIGWYYSPVNWHDPDCRSKKFNTVWVWRMQGELRELLSNYGRISLLWFDTDGGPAPWDQKQTYALVRTLQPDIVINNRLDMGSMAAYRAQAIGPYADYKTPEQRIGAYDSHHPWETCMTLGTQWSYKPHDKIKSLARCVQALVRCAGGDGNLLLDIGPRPDGAFPPRDVSRLTQIGKWLDQYGRSIYATRGGPYEPWPGGACTRSGNTIYLHVFHWIGDSLNLPGLSAKIIHCSVLTGGNANVRQNDVGITIQLPAADHRKVDTIVALTLDRPVNALPVVVVKSNTPGIK